MSLKPRIPLMLLLALLLMAVARAETTPGLRQTYDARGRLVREICVDETGAPAMCADGWHCHAIAYDAKGRKRAERYTDLAGAPCLYRGSYSGVDRQYNSRGRVARETFRGADGEVGPNRAGVTVREFTYYKNGKISRIHYFDADGQPDAPASIGAYGEKRRYHDDGSLAETGLLDADGAPMAGAAGWAYARYEHDPEGRVAMEAWFDAAGEPMAVNGCHARLRDYDDAGHVLRERYYDIQGRAATLDKGYAAVTRRYDGAGRAVEERYYDAQGAPTPCRQGYAAMLCDYGAGDKPLLRRYYDADGQPADVHGCQQVALDYDADGRLARETFLDADGHRVTRDDGYAAAVYRYDAQGRLSETAWYDADDRPVVTAKGCARTVIRRDADGNAALERYYGPDGEPIALPGGYCAIRRTFDGQRRCLSVEYLDAQGDLTPLRNRNDAMTVYDYDARGNRVRQTYYDRDRRPVIPRPGGCATTVWNYDEQDRVVSERYYDAQNRPMFTSAHHAGYAVEYSADGTVAVLTYLKPGGAPVTPTSSLPYVKLRRTYDATGQRLLREEYLDAQGRPARNRAYVYGRAHEYDDRGREIRSYTFGADGKITGGRSRVAMIVYTYAPDGTRTAARYTRDGAEVR